MRRVSRSRRVSMKSTHRRNRHLVVAADGEVVLALALARPVERERRQPAREERLLVGVALLLGGIEPHRHGDHRRTLDARGLAQDAVEVLALVGDRDPLARRRQVRQGQAPALDRLEVCGLHLRQVVHEQECAEMVVDAGALQVLAGGEQALLVQGLAAEPLMNGSALRPGAAPVVP